MSRTETIELEPVSSKVASSIRLTTPSRENSQHAASAGGNAPPLATFSAVTPATRRKERVAMLTLCWCLFLAGWNDATLGPLLPRMQLFYNVGFAIVSILFISNAVGFITGALVNVWATERFGFGKAIAAGSLLQVVAYAIQAPAPPFPVLCVAGAFNGFGIALQDAQANGIVASIKHGASAKMGILHAAYGIGALVAPLVSTQFAQMERWSFHYLVSVGLALSNSALLIIIFRGKDSDVVLTEIGSPPDHVTDVGSTAPSSTEVTTVEPYPNTTQKPQSNTFSQMMKLKTLHILATFILVYVGVEVTMGGWIVTFIINERQGGPSSGYISSGFFGGLTLGRVALLWVNKKIGEKRVVYLYTLLCIGLELIIWFVPSLIGDAVAVSLVGVLLGPMYPICMNQSAKILPRKLLTGSIGWIAGFGQAGSAIIPFMTGALASRFSISALQPLMVAMMALMLALWFIVPTEEKRDD